MGTIWVLAGQGHPMRCLGERPCPAGGVGPTERTGYNKLRLTCVSFSGRETRLAAAAELHRRGHRPDLPGT
jgi:hypothetical protein